MAITTKKVETTVELPKETELAIHEVEENSVIVNVQGWRMRVYFDENTDKEQFRYGQTIIVNYLGDIENPHSIKFEKLI
jgi:hypothetical protein